MSNSLVSAGLVEITKALAEHNHTITEGVLGGEFGYGGYYNSDVFIMHPYCWCEEETCPYCNEFYNLDFSLEDDDYISKFKLTDEIKKLGGEPNSSAPNFWHKKSGWKVWWYKYIGRGQQEIKGNIPFAEVIVDCIRDIKSKASIS